MPLNFVLFLYFILLFEALSKDYVLSEINKILSLITELDYLSLKWIRFHLYVILRDKNRIFSPTSK